MPRLPVLEELTFATPCTASWDDMKGDDRMRHCSSCDLPVFNLSGMTRTEARAFLARTNGSACVRLYKRHDGTVLTQDCPTAVSRARRRLAAAVVAAASIAGAAFAGVLGTRFVRDRAPSSGGADAFESSPTIAAIVAAFSGGKPTPVPPPMILMGTPAPIPTPTPKRPPRPALKGNAGGTTP